MTEQTFRPVFRTQADVEKFWTTICHPLGWRTRELWVVLVDEDGEPFPSVHQISDLPQEPDAHDVGRLLDGCRGLLEEFDPGGSVATLLCRPGEQRLTASDREWVRALTGIARGSGVVLEVVHVASDAAITPVPMDAVA
ncbi:hypothetical protein [Nocardioides sp. CER19]|uniref:hypothetical protein n=1 Tax=Nocardioides sp. CER19 TaxID=3038538 RepID=UPI00244C144A|nr:hypothetical protein [Nocardioides sp. CER19]MDH2414538.1 hypothetical protein [Nocardioides sp. CER19]